MSKWSSSGKQTRLGAYVGVLVLIVAAAVGANSLKNGKQKQCDSKSGCCPSTNATVVEQEPAPSESDSAPGCGCCPSDDTAAVEKEEAPAASCCPSTNATVVEKEKAPAAACCPTQE